MIKAEATVIGTVLQTPQVKHNDKGEYYYSTSLRTAVPQTEGGMKEITVYLSAPQTASGGLEQVIAGQHVTMKGTLFFDKDTDGGDQLYLRMRVRESTIAEPTMSDCLMGEMTMIGVVGTKTPELKKDKKGSSYLVFSAYSGNGPEGKRVYTWVRFIRFKCEAAEPFLAPKALIQATGMLELKFYNDKPQLSCQLKEVKEYVKNTDANGIAAAPDDAPF